MGGNGSENFEIDSNGKIFIKNNLDYETKEKYELFVFTSMGDKSISNKLEINVINVDDLETNVSLLNNSVHEGSTIDTIVGRASASGDTNISYSIKGDNSSDFQLTKGK